MLTILGSEKGVFPVLFGRNEAFVGHYAILDDLLKCLPPAAHPQNRQLTVLYGLGGVGKTQIALESAHCVYEAHPDCFIFWVPAIDLTSINVAYRSIGEALGVEGVEDEKADIRKVVHTALVRDDTGPWLLIFDNADN